MDSQLQTVVLVGVLLLASIVLAQIRQIRKLKQKTLSRSAAQIQHSSGSFALLTEHPQPLILINHAGQILFRNHHFEELPHPYGQIHSMQELDQLLGTRLKDRLTEQSGSTRFEINLRVVVGKETERIPFLAVSWPVHSPDVAMGRVVTLLPQSITRQRQKEFPVLEKQLLTYIAETGQEIGKLALRSQGGEALTIADRSRQMRELAEYLQILHGPVRAPQRNGRLQIGSMVEEAIKTLRGELRSRSLQSINTVSSGLTVLGNADDLQLLLGILLQIGISNAKPNSWIRLDAKVVPSEVLIDIVYPRQQAAAPAAFQTMQLILAKQLIVKLAGKLESIDDTDGNRLHRVHLKSA